jgi:hypothetical protein
MSATAQSPRDDAQAYHATRLTADPRRTVLWQALWRHHFRKLVSPDDCVLDLGAGHGDFINAVVARRRIAIDAWPGVRSLVAPGVEAVVGPIEDLSFLEDGSVDFAFASNVFEHLSQEQLARVLAALRPKLSARGTLNILQPNYRYAYREYFDDYTHVAVYSHVSLADFLEASGYAVVSVAPRFMPLSVKSRMPVHPWLIALYLALPAKPLGKQMFLRARPR